MKEHLGYFQHFSSHLSAQAQGGGSLDTEGEEFKEVRQSSFYRCCKAVVL